MNELEITNIDNLDFASSDSSIIVTLDDEVGIIQTMEQGPPGPPGPIGPPSTVPGPQGIPGNTVLYGTTDPTYSVGVDGNFYINTTTNFLFGPKHAGVWPAGTSLVGPQGPQGAQGAPGVGVSTVYYADNPPTGVPDGSMWWESDTGLLFIKFNDGTSSQWVIAAPQPDISTFALKTDLNGYLPLTGGTITGNLKINAANPAVNVVKGGSGNAAVLAGYNGVNPRWLMQLGDATPEAGSNGGSNFSLSRYDDAGNFLDSPISIHRGDALISLTGSVVITTTSPGVALNKTASGGTNVIYGNLNGQPRWMIQPGNATAESGGNAGSDFGIYSFTDAGALLAEPFSINRATGVVTVAGNLNVSGGSPSLNLNRSSSANNCSVSGLNNGSQRWVLELGNTSPESGGNAGSLLALSRFSDAGANLGAALTIERANGNSSFYGQMVISQPANSPFLTLYDSATGYRKILRLSTGAGGNFQIINNANSAVIFDVEDNGVASIFGNATINGSVTSNYGYICRTGINGANAANAFNFVYNGNGTASMWVDATNLGVISTASDYRIKKDVIDLPGMWDMVKALRPIKYTHADFTPPAQLDANREAKLKAERDGTDAPNPIEPMFAADDIERWGFVAHELQETLVESAAHGEKDSPDTIQTPNPWTIIAALTKALQEAMVRIEALEANAGAR
jgi:hypothetical protein